MKPKFEINRGADTGIGQSGVGYIVVPDINTREQYIKDCYRTSTVTISGGYGYGYISSVKIFPDVLQKIHFPLTSEERGTLVFWVRENFSNRPVVVGILSEEGFTNLLTENQQRIVQKIGENIVEIFLDANTSILNINVVGTSDAPSHVTIKSVSGNENSLIALETDGKVKISAKNIETIVRNNFKYFLKNGKNEELISLSGDDEKTEFKDKHGNEIIINNDNVNIRVSNKLNINDGKEPMVLGNTLVNLLKEILQAIQKLTVVTPAGNSSVPVNIASFISAEQKLNNILSKISNLD